MRITGDEIRDARERAGFTQGKLGELVGVSLRTIGNWERGESVPRSKAAVLRTVLGKYLDDPSDTAPRLAAATDSELLAEIAHRFSRTAVAQHATQADHDLAAHKGEPHMPTGDDRA